MGSELSGSRDFAGPLRLSLLKVKSKKISVKFYTNIKKVIGFTV